ncbi:hypothetical protein [Actinomadura sp. 3N407]|uniref:hypothetical protein n=1 Tax=Actinomadura sp. 3N407 TaxID=3457423 RepID=UPI003FCCC9F9
MIAGITFYVSVSVVYDQTSSDPKDDEERAVETACRALDAGIDSRHPHAVILDITHGDPFDHVPFEPASEYPAGPGPATAASLAERAEAAGVTAQALDDFVHDAASERASRVNNDGPQAQLEFLVDAYGVDVVQTMLIGLGAHA